jgi:plasmid stabilization system protein ParE
MSPMLFRKRRSGGPLRRELVMPFGSTGYVIEYEIAGPDLVVVLAVRHQREQDLH